MKKITFLTKIILLSSLIGALSCQSPESPALPFGIDDNSIQLGIEQSGNFILKSDKTFTSNDKIIFKFKAVGLTIKQGKIKTNVDIFLKKDNDVLGTQNNILGTDGLSQAITGVSSDYSSSNGTTNLELTIIPPTDTTGDITTNITLKDLNTQSKVATFETKFTLK